MEVDEEVRKTLVKNLREWLSTLVRRIEQGIEKIEKAKTVEEIMQIKQGVLAYYFINAPMYAGECYFCILHASEDEEDEMYCGECEYAEHHGVCNDEGSDWAKMRDMKDGLVKFVIDNYYRGEKYEVDDDRSDA